MGREPFLIVDVIEIKTSERDLFQVLRMACSEFRKKHNFRGSIIPTEVEPTKEGQRVKIEIEDRIILPWRMSTHETR